MKESEGTENVESFLIESRVCTLYVCTASVKRLTRLQLCSAKAGEPIDNAKGIERNHRASIELRPRWSSHTQAPKSPPQRLDFRPSFQGIHLYFMSGLRQSNTLRNHEERETSVLLTHQATQDAAHFDLDTMLCPESRLESLWSEQKVKGRLWRDSMLESLWSEQKVKCGWPAAVKHATQS